jgi:hypothetical protein
MKQAMKIFSLCYLTIPGARFTASLYIIIPIKMCLPFLYFGPLACLLQISQAICINFSRLKGISSVVSCRAINP